MEFSPFVDRIGGEGAAGWAIHFEAADAASRGEDVVVLSVGDPDFPTPTGIIDSAVAAMRDGDTHYAEIVGRESLRQAIADHLRSRHGLPVGPANVTTFAGTQNALFASAMCLLTAGDTVLAGDPMYLTYEATLRASGAEVIAVPQPADQPVGRPFRPDIAAIDAAVAATTKGIVLTTPANPTGVVMTRDELEGVADIARRHDLWIIADEVYADLVFSGEHVSIGSLPAMAERTVTIGSLSKSHAMTGWRLGWAAGPAELQPHFYNLGLAMLYGLPGFIQEAGRVAVAEHQGDVAEMREIYRRRRDRAVLELAEAVDLPVLSPEAGMFVMVDVRAHDDDAAAWARRLYDATGVSVLDAGAFGSAAAGWVRLSFTTSDELLAEGCRRIVAFTRGA